MKIFLIFVCLILAFSNKTIAKETTYNKELFNKVLSDGKVVVVSLVEINLMYSQIKVLNKAKKDFNNIEYFF